MNPIERSEVLSLGEYEAVRPRFRERVIAEKKQRRAPVGEDMTVVFENRDTVLYQIQEMLRVERITKESGILHEIETYNELVPADGELSMTLFIEVPEKAKREALLEACAGMETHVFLEVDGERVQAVAIDRDGASEKRTTAVQYYKVPLGGAAKKLEGGDVAVAVVIDHDAYSARTELSPEVVKQLSGDLTWSS
jgi:hypothetical protein